MCENVNSCFWFKLSTLRALIIFSAEKPRIPWNRNMVFFGRKKIEDRRLLASIDAVNADKVCHMENGKDTVQIEPRKFNKISSTKRLIFFTIQKFMSHRISVKRHLIVSYKRRKWKNEWKPGETKHVHVIYCHGSISSSISCDTKFVSFCLCVQSRLVRVLFSLGCKPDEK